MKRLLTIGHSYVVAANRMLAHEMARAGNGAWEVTAVAPRAYRGDLRHIELETIPGEACRVVPVDVRLQRVPHLSWFGPGTRTLLREPWDVVHCWEEPYVLAASQVAALCPPRAAFVFSTFQNLPKRYPPPFRHIESRVLERATGWIAFGQGVRSTQVDRDARYAALPGRVIPPGVDLSAFRPDPQLRAMSRARLGWADAGPVIGFVGRFVPQKGIGTLIAALEQLPGSWRALFVGAGPELGRIHALAARHPGRVKVVTDAAHGDVPAWLNAMDLVCAPSVTTGAWREQFGRMLVEAMACGVPVVGSDSGEIPHVIADAGLVARERDVCAWRDAVHRLLTSPALRDDLRQRGLRRVREQFTWPGVARRHLAFFETLQ